MKNRSSYRAHRRGSRIGIVSHASIRSDANGIIYRNDPKSSYRTDILNYRKSIRNRRLCLLLRTPSRGWDAPVRDPTHCGSEGQVSTPSTPDGTRVSVEKSDGEDGQGWLDRVPNRRAGVRGPEVCGRVGGEVGVRPVIVV